MNALIKKHKSSVEELCRSLQVKKLYVFGSATGDSLKKESDLDFLLSFKDSLSPGEYADNYFLLHQKLEQLFDRKIDLITERSLSNPYFIDSINRTRKLIYDERDQKVPV